MFVHDGIQHSARQQLMQAVRAYLDIDQLIIGPAPDVAAPHDDTRPGGYYTPS